MTRTDLINGDIVLIDGKSGIYADGVTTLYDGERTAKDPDYIIRIPEELPKAVVYNIELPELEIGARSMYVEIMQSCLKWHGYKIIVDGDFGSGTFEALHKFRNDCYLTGDTICDADTWKYLLQF